MSLQETEREFAKYLAGPLDKKGKIEPLQKRGDPVSLSTREDAGGLGGAGLQAHHSGGDSVRRKAGQ